MISVLEPDRKIARPKVATGRLNAMTIDVEDYFHVSGFEKVVSRNLWHAHSPRIEKSTYRLLELLENAQVKATFFVLGWVATHHPKLVKAIDDAGHEIGSHSYWHRLIYQQSPTEFRQDLRQSRDVLEDLLGMAVRSYRAPSFSITSASVWALDILAEEGFMLDSSIYPTHHDRYGIPGTPLEPHRLDRTAGTLWEFPPPVYSALGYPVPIGGGGYFRLYPYAFTRRGLHAINAAGRPFAFYVHPWEIDPEQPRLNPGWSRRFRHYVNLHRTETRLRRLLKEFNFGTLSEAMAPCFAPVPKQTLALAA